MIKTIYGQNYDIVNVKKKLKWTMYKLYIHVPMCFNVKLQVQVTDDNTNQV